MKWGIYLTLPLIVILVALQSTIFSYIPVRGVIVQVVPVFLVAWALWRGSADSVPGAFIAGMLIDLHSIGPLGVTSVALMAGLLILIPLQLNLSPSRFLLPLILAGTAMLTFLLVNLFLLTLARYPNGRETLILLPQTVMLHAFIILPVYWVLRGFGRIFGSRRRIEL